ncbi:hypothetical protein ACTSKR_10830 [Chitinibacteraceae bacterium HSL-7]
MKKFSKLCLALSGALLSLQAYAAESLFVFQDNTKVSAEIAAIDSANRVLTFKLPNGELADFAVSPAVKQFDQLVPGDVVAVMVDRAVAFDLAKGEGGLPLYLQEEGSGRSNGKPGAAWEVSELRTADVVAVDAGKGLVKLRGPKGRTQEVEVQHKERLANVAVGDQVQVRMKRALAIWVEKAVMR